jgi:AcrR family transcriptional regulator
MASRSKAPLAPDDLKVVVEPAPKVKPRPGSRRRGRPVDSDGLTAQRILAAARQCFAGSGYVGTSMHTVAARAGLTTGALYHHFGSKRELYLAVFNEVEERFYESMRAAAASQASFVAKVEALFDEAVHMARTDPTMPAFSLTFIGDLTRHPDLVPTVQSALVRRDFFLSEVVDTGIATGEVAAADRQVVLEMLVTIGLGVMAMGGVIPAVQARAVEGLKRLLAGTLIAS